MSNTIEYPALRTVQVPGGSPLILFSAPALEVETWAGVPQKKSDGDQQETVGFQRDEDNSRVAALAAFLREPANIVQNPLLCARRETSVGSVCFKPADASVDLDAPGAVPGVLEVKVKELEELPLLQLLEGVMAQIEDRLEDLKDQEPDQGKVAELVSTLREQSEEAASDEGDADNDDGEGADNDEAMTALFTDETHVVDFWHELAARAEAIRQLAGFDGNEAAGFTREALASFLKPVIVVDGQHRLRGAIEAARERSM